MKTKGINRIYILVKDFDKAMDFFANSLGIELTELTEIEGESVADMGERIALNLDAGVEIMSPILPLKESYSDLAKQIAAMLDEASTDSLLYGLNFNVNDTAEAEKDAVDAGLTIAQRAEADELPELGVRNFKEIFFDPAQCLGLNIGMVSFDKC